MKQIRREYEEGMKRIQLAQGRDLYPVKTGQSYSGKTKAKRQEEGISGSSIGL